MEAAQAILERGFSVVLREKTGKVLRSAGETKPGERLIIHPLGGIITANVETAVVPAAAVEEG